MNTSEAPAAEYQFDLTHCGLMLDTFRVTRALEWMWKYVSV